jgi:hypothetical protein
MLTTIANARLSSVHGGGMIHGAGEAFGFGAGVAVTAALGAVPSWSQQVPGQPAGFQKRHESVLGPKIATYASGLAPGPWKQLATGVADGATAAPPWSFAHGL